MKSRWHMILCVGRLREDLILYAFRVRFGLTGLVLLTFGHPLPPTQDDATRDESQSAKEEAVERLRSFALP